MAENDPIAPKDDAEAAYARGVLEDDAGREQRRARLMAALPRPQAAHGVAVARSELAWRWHPYALGMVAAAALLVAFVAWRAPAPEPRRTSDPRVAAASAASEAAVVAQVTPSVQVAAAPAAEAPLAAAKASRTKPSPRPTPTIVADATSPASRRESETGAAPPVAEAPRAAITPPREVPPAAAAPVAAPVAMAEAAASASSVPPAVVARALARSRTTTSLAQGLAASDTASPAPAADALLLAAVSQADATSTRAALQSGASIQRRDAEGRTPLMLAARTGSREVVDVLLTAGARKWETDPRGLTAADHAEAQGHAELAAYLR